MTTTPHNQHSQPDRTVLVTGATGRVGRELVAQLISRSVAVRAGTRHPDNTSTKAVTTAGTSAEMSVVPLDLADPSSLAAALPGVDAVYLMWPFFEDGEQTRERFEPVAELLGEHVGRVVYLSSQAVEQMPDSFWAVVERALEAHVTEWTMLRPTGFAVNAQQWADQIRQGDVVRWPFGQVPRPLIHEHDVAAVAAATLLEDGHHAQRYVISGPELITQEQQVEAIGAAIGRPVRWEEIDRDQAKRDLDLPGQMLDAWESFLTRPEPVTDQVRAITGHRARSFASWARDHAADFTTPNPGRE